MIYVCNVDENSIITGNELSKQVEGIANETTTKVLNISADIESEISLIQNLMEKQEFLLSIGLKETSLSKLVREGYDLLNLLIDAWEVKGKIFAGIDEDIPQHVELPSSSQSIASAMFGAKLASRMSDHGDKNLRKSWEYPR